MLDGGLVTGRDQLDQRRQIAARRCETGHGDGAGKLEVLRTRHAGDPLR
jgi:hypothetical protein